MFLLGILGIGAFFIIIISGLFVILFSTKLILMDQKVKELERLDKLEGNEISDIQLLTKAVNSMFDEMAKFQMKLPPDN
jgi:hypothetical protein